MSARPLLILSILLTTSVSAQSLDDLKGMTSSDAAKAANSALAGSASDVLQGQLGLSEDQVNGGIGSMLSLANEKLSAGEFDKLAGYIPGADKYMDTAKNLGAVSGPVGDIAGLEKALGKLGLSADDVSKFIPAISDYLGKLGGDDVSKLVAKFLG